ncbi:hypothetical protein [Bacteroides thetaiotaomicron]|uniref:hypothetical protein n=1 Tax=Bacteroides thetaiotaomicron TaxID=818 RepID=UPI00321AC32F
MKISPAILDRINPETLIQAIRSFGWIEESPLFNNSIRQFVSSNEKYVALIPIDKRFSDYQRVLTDSLKEIVISEQTTIESFINKLINPSYDIIKWRVANQKTIDGNFPFLEMRDTIDSIHNVLASTCADVLNPVSYHKKVNVNRVNNTFSDYKYGQTEFGSYIINVLCPLGRNYQFNAFTPEEELPIPRRINEKFVSSVIDIQNEIDKNNLSKIEEDVDSKKFSVNFLEALIDMQDKVNYSDIEIKIDWCTRLPLQNETISSELKLKPQHIEPIAMIAEKFKPKMQDEENKSFYGKIESLGSDPDLKEREFVNIKVVTIGEDKKEMFIQSKLNYYQYFEIVSEAFKNGSNIKLTGKFINGRTKLIENGEFEKLD